MVQYKGYTGLAEVDLLFGCVIGLRDVNAVVAQTLADALQPPDTDPPPPAFPTRKDRPTRKAGTA